jgi:NADH:ubiquinone oxidoreductase subunit E
MNPTPVRRFEHGSRVPGWDEAADLNKPPAEIPDLATTPVPGELQHKIEEYMSRYPDRRSAVLPALREAQRHHGWCSPEAMDQVAAVMRVTPAYLESIASFYDMLETTPVGPHSVYVCTNITCSLRGADRLYEEMLGAAGDDAAINVRSFECLGACDIAPMASVNGTYVGPLDLADCQRIVDDLHAGRPVLEDKQLARRPVGRPHPTGSDAEAAQPRPAVGPSATANEPSEGRGTDL